MAAIAAPALATFGGRERNAEADLAAIRAHASAARSINSAVIADADHFYDGCEAALARVIAQWADAL